ncbi:ComF family protein [Stackebrandtia soli]|uniref:ComF family protein n=1 Tax=Stackebrandtia soli TaxID=1892856 RepID=UPI0039E98B75
MTTENHRPTWIDRLRELVLPIDCAGCAAPAAGQLCPRCHAELVSTRSVRLSCRDGPDRLGAGWYEGPLRRALVAYKERGRRALAMPLARLLSPVLTVLDGDVVCVPIPATAAARRRRGFDHVGRLASALASIDARMHVAPVLRARRRPDSVGLSATERVRAAESSFRVAPGAASRLRSFLERRALSLVVLDDIVTTGATAAAATRVLLSAGVRPRAVIAVAVVPPLYRKINLPWVVTSRT